MKVRLVLIVVALGWFGTIHAQGTAVLSGRVMDKATHLDLPYASVSLLTLPDSIFIGGVLAGDDGRFVISGIANGTYSLQVSFVGYSSVILSLFIGDLNRNYDAGKIELNPVSSEIDAVTVLARKAMVSEDLDRKTISVEDNVAQTGLSVLDFMKSLPGITVDQEGKVLLRGSDKVTVLIDGKQSSLTGFGDQKGLDNIPVGNIESIEIINNPSAKYDAAGMAGIINIKYKKTEVVGLHGDAGLTLAIGQLSKRKADVPSELGSYWLNPKYQPNLSLNYRKGKFNTFFQGDMMWLRRLPNNEFSTRTYADGKQIISQVPENRRQQHYILKGGVDYFIDDHNTLSFNAIYDYEDHHDTAQVPYYERTTGQRYRNWGWLEYEITGYMNYSLQYKHNFAEPGHEFRAGVQYTKGWEDESYYLNDSSVYRNSRDTTQILAIEHTTIVNADYFKPMRFGRFETGFKIMIRRIPVTYTTGKGENTVIYPGLGEWSEWGENTFSGYLNYVLEKKKFDVEAGLRAENTDVFYNLASENIYYPHNDQYSYFRLFPNVRLTLKLNTKNSLSAFYNRRIDRPGEPEVRVFPKYDDPELLKVGNPYLRPQLSQSFELAYKLKWNSGSVFLSGYHRITADPYTRIYSMDTTNANYDIVNKVYQNTKGATNTGVEVVLSQNMSKNLKFTGSYNWYKNVLQAFQGKVLFPYERSFSLDKMTDHTWNAKVSGQYSFPWQMQLQLTGVYYAPLNIQQGRQLARSSVDVGLKQRVFKGKGELNVSVSDLFNRFGIKQEIRGDGVSVLYENYYETQVIAAGMRIRF